MPKHDHPPVLVYWSDTVDDPKWNDHDEAECAKLAKCSTLGFLLNVGRDSDTGDRVVRVAPTESRDGDYRACSVVVIPLLSVRRIVSLRTKRVLLAGTGDAWEVDELGASE